MKTFADSRGYQAEIWSLVPGHALMNEILLRWISEQPQDGRVGVVGPGPGMEIVSLAEVAQGCHFEAWEPEPAMSESCARLVKHAGFADRVTLHTEPLPTGDASWDAGVCLLVGHLVPFNRREAFWSDLASWLKPGSKMLFAEIVRMPAWQRRTWIACSLSRGLPMTERERIEERLSGGFALLPAEHTELIARQAGFVRVKALADLLGLRIWELER